MSESDSLFRLRPAREEVTGMLERGQVERARAWGNPLVEEALDADEWKAIALAHRLARVKGPEQARFLARVRRGEAQLQEAPHLDARLNALLLVRADAQADREGALWTPLLDAMESSGMVPHVLEGEEAVPLSPTLLHPGRGLLEWIQQVRSPRELLRLTHFQSHPLLASLVAHAPHWDRALLLAVLAARPELVGQVARRQNLAAEETAEMVRWCLERLEQEGNDAGVGGLMGHEAAALALLHWEGRYLPQSGELERLLLPVRRGSCRAMRNRLDGAPVRKVEPWKDSLRLLLQLRGGLLQESQLEECFQAALGDPQLLAEVVAHPDATLSMKRGALPQSRHHQQVRQVLLEDEEARSDAEVRAHLLQSEQVEVYASLLRDAQGAERGLIFRWLAAREPRRALAEARRLEPQHLREIEARDFAPLLQALGTEERLEVMRLVGEASGIRVVAPEEFPPSGRRGR